MSAPAEPLRSYRLRRRATAGQVAAIDRLWPRLGVVVDGRPLDVGSLFGRRAPLVVEVGHGTGEATAAMAALDPARDVLAVDVHRAGTGALLRRVDEAGIGNVRVASGDGVVLLRDMLPPRSVDEVRVLFPDPWPKARHAKRRLLAPPFLDLCAQRLRPGGALHVASDWAPYVAGLLEHLAGDGRWQVEVAAQRPAWRAETRYEARALVEGRRPRDVRAVLTR